MSNSSGSSIKETHRQSQLGVSIYRRFLRTAYAFVRLPYVMNGLETEGQSTVEKKGLGDIELLAGNEFRGQLLGFHPAVAIGMKLPTGRNDLEGTATGHQHSPLDHGDADGNRLPEHAQLGTGSIDVLAMAHLQRGVQWRWQSTFGYRFNGENSYHYQYGSVAWLDITVARSITRALEFNVGGRARFSERDTSNGLEYRESGGDLGAAIIEASYSFRDHLRASVFTALPVVNNLNGSQVESPVFTAGLSGSF